MSAYSRRHRPARIPHAPTLAVVVRHDATPRGLALQYLAAATYVAHAGPDGYTVTRAPRPGMTFADVVIAADVVVVCLPDRMALITADTPGTGGGRHAA